MIIRSHACNPSMSSNVWGDPLFQAIETRHSVLKRRDAFLTGALPLEPARSRQLTLVAPSSGACACRKWIAPMKLMQAVAKSQ
jgi:hypothetical protein